jgi:putative ABC transport system ATP-binding protein
MSITLSQLQKRYVGPDGSVVPVVEIEHFSLGDGEQVALVGSSGSGKTTLLHLIAGILTPDSGKILFDATSPQQRVDLAQMTEAERDVFRGRNIGYIFQTHHLLGGFTALENVLLGMSFTGRAHDPAWATHLLKEVGLGERLHYKPQKLSVGQQQRVAVARALAARPQLIFADEPTGNLDSRSGEEILAFLRRAVRELGQTIVMVTHDPIAAAHADRVLFLADGRLVDELLEPTAETVLDRVKALGGEGELR